MSELIVREFNGRRIEQRPGDGYMDATAMCRATGKKWSHYWSNKTTQEFVSELSRSVGIPTDQLAESNTTGVNELRGTYVHPKLAMHLAQWCSPKFAVLVSGWVLDILTTGKADIRPADSDPLLAQIEHVRQLRLAQIEQEKQIAVARETAERALREAQAAIRTSESNYGWYSVLAYCNRIGRSLTQAQSSAVGKALSARMRAAGMEPQRVSDQKFGHVNLYPEKVLEEFFSSLSA